MAENLIPINCFPWGGSCRPEAYAIATDKADAISFRLWCFEKHPRITCREPNSAVYLDSCLEVFLNPFPAFSEDYLNFEMNAAGALLLSIVGVSLLVFLASLAISVAMSRIPGLKKVI